MTEDQRKLKRGLIVIDNHIDDQERLEKHLLTVGNYERAQVAREKVKLLNKIKEEIERG